MPLSRRTLGYLTLAALSVGAVAIPASRAGASIAAAPTSYVTGDYTVVSHPVTAAIGGGSLHAAVLPASVDLRANVPAVQNQGAIGDCTAWAIGYYSIGELVNASHGTGAPFAPLYLYLRSLRGGSTAPDGGTSGWDTLTEAQANGIDTQANYTQGTMNFQIAPSAAEVANAANYKVTQWAHLFQGTGQGGVARTEIETALAAGDPVALAYEVYDNFETLGPNQVYNGPAGADEGGHMVTAVGYNATGVIIRNSWGTAWGTNGDATLSWAYVDQYTEDAYSVGAVSTPAAAAPASHSTATTTQPSAPSQPATRSLSVTSGPTSGSTTVTISGQGLAGATAVTFGGKPVAFVSTTDPTSGITKLVATSPAHAAGSVAVAVTRPGGTISVGTFTYRAAVPTVSSVAPKAVSGAGGSVVTVVGTGFTGVTVVHLGAVSVRAVPWSNTVLKFIAPAHAAGVISVQAVSSAGPSQLSVGDRLTYVPAPAKAGKAKK
jgi:hypothetical protein